MAKKKALTPDEDKIYGGIAYKPPCSDPPELVEQKVGELRRHLEGIYFAAGVMPDADKFDPLDLLDAIPRLTQAVKNTVLCGTTKEYLATNMDFVPYYRNIESLIDMLRCNMGVKMHWWPPKGE